MLEMSPFKWTGAGAGSFSGILGAAVGLVLLIFVHLLTFVVLSSVCLSLPRDRRERLSSWQSNLRAAGS